MTIRIIIFISTLIAMLFSSCKSTPDLKEEEVYTIINEIIADDSMYLNSICWKFKNIQLTDAYKREFTKQDVEFIGHQKELFKNITIKPGKLKWFQRRKKVFVNVAIDTICDKGFLYHLSFPLISADRQKVIMNIEEDCHCMLGGGASTNLYEKKNGHWVRTKTLDGWIGYNRTRGEKTATTNTCLAITQ